MLLETQVFEFGEYVLDRREGVLLRHGVPLSVPPKVLQLLIVLIENSGHIVEKEALMQRVWEGSFVEDSNLTYSIRQLRKILGDDIRRPQFIETVPRRGYRFIASLKTNADENVLFGNGTTGLKVEGSGNGLSTEFEIIQRRAGRSASKPNYLIVLGFCATLILGLGALYWLYPPGSADNAALTFERLTSNGKTKSAAVSPDGKFVGYIHEDQDQQSLWLKNVAAGSDVQILPPVEGTALDSLAFSPDGNFIYFVAGESLFQQPLLGGTAKKVVQAFGSRTQANPITFSPDGARFAFVRQLPDNKSDLVIANTDGTSERILASSSRPAPFLRSASWSPDGNTIAVAGNGKVFIVQVADGAVSPVPSPPDWTIVLQVAWQGDGSGLWVIATSGRSSISHQIWSLSYPRGEARNVTNDLNNYQSISLTAGGSDLVAVRMEQVAHIWMVTTGLDTSQAKQLTHGIDRYDGIFGLSWLRDGNILYETVPRNGNGEIWQIDTAGRGGTQLLDEAGSAAASPDGNYIVFQSNDVDGIGLFKLNLRDRERTRLTSGADTWVTFSPDGKWVVYTRWGNEVELWKAPMSGGEPVKVTNISEFALTPAVSPDGQLVAFRWGKVDRNQPAEIAGY